MTDTRTAGELGPPQRVVLISRACVACGEPETTAERKQIYHLPAQHLPAGRCARCGSTLVLPSETLTLTIRPNVRGEELFGPYWGRKGRPPTWLREARAREGIRSKGGRLV